MSKLPFVSSTNNNSLNDLIEVIGFGFTFAETLKQAKADGGGVNLGDLPKILNLVGPAGAAYEGYETIPTAWQNASEAEKREVYDYFVLNFDIPDDKVEEKVEKGVLAAVYVLDFILA